MSRLLTQCPVCSGEMQPIAVQCKSCQAQVAAQFDTCRFCAMLPEHLSFVETFLRCEGNLSRVGEELGISYPTVRNRLVAAIAALNLEVVTAASPGVAPGSTNVEQPAAAVAVDSAEVRRSVLNRLSSGEINAEQAAEELRNLL